MTEMLATCPTTEKQFSLGLRTDVQSLQAVWNKVIQVKCPHCGKCHHEVSVREAFVQGALNDRLVWAS